MSETIAIQGRPSRSSRRSKVAGGMGIGMLDEVDGRSRAKRRYDAMVSELVAHLGGEPTFVEEAMAQETAFLLWWSEGQRAAAMQGEPFEMDAYVTTSNTTRRYLLDLGLKRQARDLVPTMDQLLRQARAGE